MGLCFDCLEYLQMLVKTTINSYVENLNKSKTTI